MRRMIRDIAAFSWVHKRFWLVPILLALLLVGVLIAISESSSLSYFIYPLF